MHVKLRTGMFELATLESQAGSQSASPTGEAIKSLDRRCLIVYPGKFQSLDGEVDVTEEHLQRLADNHNSVVNQLKRMAEGAGLPMKACPPIQLDHSRSARDTVGRLVGPVELGEHQLESGEKVKGLFGTARILGEENVEHVRDGRWIHLSIGADLEEGVLSELTITPFPAAANASMLSVKQPPAEVPTQPAPSTKGDPMKVGFSSYLTEQCKMSEEESKKHIEKMRKRLMDKDQLSEADADKKLGEMPHDEAKRLMDEDAAEEQKVAKMATLTAARTRMTELHGLLKTGTDKIRLAQKKTTIYARLSKLKAEAKITPAEIKKLDISKLAAGSEETINAALETFSAREPQVLAGLVGNANATAIAKLSEDRKRAIRMAKMEMAARKNMGKPVPDEIKKLAEMPAAGAEESEVNVHIDTTPHTEYFEAGEWEEMKALMGAGKDDEAKAVFARVLTRCTTKMADPASSEEVPAAMGAAAEEMKQLQAQVEEAVRLASVLAEGTA